MFVSIDIKQNVLLGCLVLLATALLQPNAHGFSQEDSTQELNQDGDIACLSLEDGFKYYSRHVVLSKDEDAPLPADIILQNLKMNGEYVIDDGKTEGVAEVEFKADADRSDTAAWKSIDYDSKLESDSYSGQKYISSCNVVFDTPYESIRRGSSTFFKDKVLGTPKFSENNQIHFPFRDLRGNAGTLRCVVDLRYAANRYNGSGTNRIHYSTGGHLWDFESASGKVGVPMLFLLHGLIKTGAISGQICPAQRIFGEEQGSLIQTPNIAL